LDAEKWYSVSQSEILRAGGRRLLHCYNRSHIEALVQLYPELNLKREKFFRHEKGWKAPANQRNFLDTFARSNNFNPLDAEKWYSVTHSEIIRAGGRGLFDHYNRSHINLLIQIYPELILKKGNFLKSTKGWKALGNQRRFFDSFARSKKYNPLHAEKWYSVTHNEIIRAGGWGVLNYYNGSHMEALVKLYPELMLEKGNFSTTPFGK